LARNRNKKKHPNYYKPNFWGAARDVLIASMNKGQFPFAVFAIIILALILKMPSEDVTDFAYKVLQALVNTRILGWALTILLALGWFISNKALRRKQSTEFRRIGNEKKKVQEELILRDLPSSNK